MDIRELTGHVGEALDDCLTSLQGVISVDYWDTPDLGTVTVKVATDNAQVVESYEILIRKVIPS